MGVTIPGPSGEVKESYEISNSLRFNDAEDTKLDRPGISGTLSKAHTFSVWIKRDRTKPSGRHTIAGMGDGSGDISWLMFNNDSLIYYATGSGTYALTTTAKYRDLSAWYHVVAKVDTTQSTASNRFKFYVNGVEQAFTGTILPQNHQANMDAQIVAFNSSDVMDGYMSEFHFLDGVAYDPTYFGEFDSNGVWVPIEYTGGNYGTFGFYLEFKQTGTSQNSSGMGADTSGNDNHFAVTNLGATDVTEDTPTNNFATLNPIDTHTTSPTLAEGNTDFTGVSGTPFTPARSTIAVSQGKWYMEYKFKTAGGGVGVMTTQSPINDHLRDDADVRSIYRGHGGYYYGRNNSGAIDDVGGNSVTLSADDIVGIALDLDNGYVYFHKNGTYMNGQDGSTQGNPAGNNGGSGGAANHPTQLLTNQHDGVWAFMAYDISTATSGRVICNFGNPPYTPSSGNTDGKYGNFEYAPPSGYYALCTKRLAEFG